MVLVISRFRVRNGMEDAVRVAFDQRPRLVEEAAGFLGIEVFTDAADDALFYLVTRWTSAAAFHAWHASHQFQESQRGIPKGLKLDPEVTEIRVMERFHPGPVSTAEVLESFAAVTADLHLITVDAQGRIAAVNRGAAHWLGRDEDALRGQALASFCASQDEATLDGLLDPEAPETGEVRLSMVDSRDRPYSLRGSFRRDGEGIVLVGTPDTRSLHELQEQMQAANNELAELARENERRRREVERLRAQLEAAHTELEDSYWHLKKIQEVLPICMGCSKVKTGEASWESVVDYLKANSLFLSHGYCPDCKERILEDYRKNKSRGDPA
ncbi:MAG: antibiotic biosynthesis monooxygenase [Gammaproteobacteria bacterium]|nr:antibiotic biosynthesis monooxygenase [Gammaproteobacteria bacterium]